MVDLEEVRNTLYFGFLIIVGFLFGIMTRFIWGEIPYGSFVSVIIPILEVIVSVATLIFLAMQLQEIVQDRNALVNIAEKERRLARLREQLDFYLPVYTEINNDESNSEFDILVDLYVAKHDVQYQYELFATTKLQKLLRLYFSQIYLELAEVEDLNVHNFYGDIINQIISDFENLKEEYSELTSD